MMAHYSSDRPPAYGDSSRRWQEPNPQAQEITSLRKAGQLKQAYEQAKLLYSQGKREDAFMQAYTWIFYDCLKRYFETGNRFFGDIKAYCSTLSQIRRFPTRRDRDDMFLGNLEKHVLRVGWGLRKQQRASDIRILSTEVCKWSRGSALYTPDIARMLLICTKPNDADTVPVLSWLGIGNVPWSGIASGRYRATVSEEAATNAFIWAFYEDLKGFVGDDDGRRKADATRFTSVLSTIRRTIPNLSSRHEALEYAVKQLVHMGWEFSKSKNQRGLDTLLTEATEWGRTSAMHTEEVLKMFHVALRKRPLGTIRLVEWYGLSGLSRELFSQRVYEGKLMPSLAQEMVKDYLDALMTNDSTGTPLATQEQKQEACDQVSVFLKDPRCTEWTWERYSLGKLMSDIGRFDDARALLAPVVIMNQTESWAWFEYGKTWAATSPERYESCLFMGLSRADDPNLSKRLHEAAARLFAERGQFADAKAEILMLQAASEGSGGRTPPVVDEMRSADWFDTTIASTDMKGLYRSLSHGAEDIVGEHLPWTEFYVDKVIKDKGIVFILSVKRGVSFSRNPFIRTSLKSRKAATIVKEGHCYRGRLYSECRKLFGTPEEYPDAKLASQAISTYAGELDLVKNFGFVNDHAKRVWISPALLADKSAKQFQHASGGCRITYKLRKDKPEGGEWSWEATSLELGEEAAESTYRKRGSGTFEFAVTSNGSKRDFGFVTDDLDEQEYYTPAPLISEYGISDHQEVAFVAEKSWDSRKERWGWRVTEVSAVTTHEATDSSEPSTANLLEPSATIKMVLASEGGPLVKPGQSISPSLLQDGSGLACTQSTHALSTCEVNQPSDQHEAAESEKKESSTCAALYTVALNDLQGLPLEVRSALAQRDDTPTEALGVLAEDAEESVRRLVAANPHTPVCALVLLAQEDDLETKAGLAGNPNTPTETLSSLVKLGDTGGGAKAQDEEVGKVLSRLAYNPSLPEDLFARLMQARHVVMPFVGAGIATSTTIDPSRLELLHEFSYGFNDKLLARNQNTPQSTLVDLAASSSDETRTEAAKNPHIPMETLDTLATDPNVNVVDAAAQNTSATPELLWKLYGEQASSIHNPEALSVLGMSESDYVRYLVAMNYSTPGDTLEELLDDDCEEVRREAEFNAARLQLAGRLTLKRHNVAPIHQHQIADHKGSGPLWERYDARVAQSHLRKSGTNVFRSLAANPNVPDDLLRLLIRTNNDEVLLALATNRSATQATLEVLSRCVSPDVRASVASNLSSGDSILRKLAKDADDWVRCAVACNENASPDVLYSLCNDTDERVILGLLSNRNLPSDGLLALLRIGPSELHESIVDSPSASHDVLRELMDDPNEIVRVKVAGHKLATESMLDWLVDDKSDYVRLAVANNPNATSTILRNAFRDTWPAIRAAALLNPSVRLVDFADV